MSIHNNVFRIGANQVVSYTSTSTANTTAFQAGTNAVRVLATTGCHIAFGQSPTATSSNAKLAAGISEYLVVTPGQKIAAIRTSTSGTLNVTEVS